MVNIKKKNGIVQEFNVDKLKNSVMKAGAPSEVADKIATEVASKVKEGTTTAEIKNMVTSALASTNATLAGAYTKYVKTQMSA